MSSYDRQYYVALIQRYFGSVMQEDIATLHGCFTADGRVTILHGDNPRRRFHANPTAGQQSMTSFYEHIWQNFHAHFGDFTYVIDAGEQRCAAIFVPVLTPKPGSAYAAGGVITLSNCNFFWCRDGKIYDMVIYYANPALGERLGLTSGPVTVPPLI